MTFRGGIILSKNFMKILDRDDKVYENIQNYFDLNQIKIWRDFFVPNMTTKTIDNIGAKTEDIKTHEQEKVRVTTILSINEFIIRNYFMV